MPEIIEPEFVGEGKAWLTPSKTRPDTRHLTILTEDGWFCYCEGFRYNSTCWHVDTLMAQEGGKPEDEFQISM